MCIEFPHKQARIKQLLASQFQIKNVNAQINLLEMMHLPKHLINCFIRFKSHQILWLLCTYPSPNFIIKWCLIKALRGKESSRFLWKWIWLFNQKMQVWIFLFYISLVLYLNISLQVLLLHFHDTSISSKPLYSSAQS